MYKQCGIRKNRKDQSLEPEIKAGVQCSIRDFYVGIPNLESYDVSITEIQVDGVLQLDHCANPSAPGEIAAG